MDTRKGRLSHRHHRRLSLIEPLEPRRLMSGSWSTVDTVPSQWFSSVSGMAADNSGNVFAVGYTDGFSPLLLREKPAGSAAWTTVTTMDAGQWGEFNGVAVDAAGDVFITGRTSSSYFATWELAKGSTTLKQIDLDSAAGGSGGAVTVDGSGSVYVVGSDRTKYKGSTATKWTVRKGTFANGKWSFSTVDQLLQAQGGSGGVTVAPSGIYVLGQYNGNWTIRKSATGASGTWVTVDTLSGGYIGGLAADAVGNVYAAGESSTGHWMVRESTNGGSSWTTVDGFSGTISGVYAEAVTRDPSGNMVVAGWGQDSVGDEYAIVRTNAGGSWTTLDSYGYPDGNAYYDAVAADTSGNLYAGGEVFDNAGTFDNWMIRSQPAAPTNLTAVTDAIHPSSQINVTWANTAGSDETGFAVYRSLDGVTFTQVATVGAGATAYSDTGLSSGTTYFYYVVSLLNAHGMSAQSNQAAATTSA